MHSSDRANSGILTKHPVLFALIVVVFAFMLGYWYSQRDTSDIDALKSKVELLESKVNSKPTYNSPRSVGESNANMRGFEPNSPPILIDDGWQRRHEEDMQRNRRAEIDRNREYQQLQDLGNRPPVTWEYE